jgi:hypothetical protein
LSVTRSLKPLHYQDGSYNASYLLPLVLAWHAGGIKAYEGTQARSPLGTLTESQRAALFDEAVSAVSYRVSVRPADGRLHHGFELMSKATKAWAGTVFLEQQPHRQRRGSRLQSEPVGARRTRATQHKRLV